MKLTLRLTCVVLIVCSGLQAQVANNNAAWELFADRLVAAIKGTATGWGGVQLVTIPMQARWNDKDFGNYYAWHVLGDQLPKWSPTYQATPQLISNTYGLFVKSIKLPLADPRDAAKAEAARKAWVKKDDELQTAWEQVPGHWQAFNQNQQGLPELRRLTFDSWFAQFDGKKLGGLQNEVDAVGQKYASYVAQAYKGFQFFSSLVTEYDNKAYQLQTKSPDGLTLAYRTYNVSPDLQQWVDDSKNLVTKGTPSRTTMSYKANETHTSVTSTKFGGSGSFFNGFLGFQVGGNYSRVDVDMSSASTGFSFEARLGQFTISPGRWFSAEAVRFFKDGPFETGSVIGDPKNLWGPNGKFNLMPITVVVAFRPKVTAVLSASQYRQMKEAYNAGGGISFGPFSFGASYQKSTEKVDFADSANSFTIEDGSDVPQIIAIVSQTLPDFQ